MSQVGLAHFPGTRRQQRLGAGADGPGLAWLKHRSQAQQARTLGFSGAGPLPPLGICLSELSEGPDQLRCALGPPSPPCSFSAPSALTLIP